MKTKQLGTTSFHLSRVGFGAWAIGGGDYAFGWGPQDDLESISAIHKALDLGINWIDTAAVYGLGHSETIVARALKGRDRSKIMVATKCAMRWDEKKTIRIDLSAKSVRYEAEQSLRRLETDVIDLYQIHWPSDEEHLEEGWAEIAKLIQEGKVRYAGVSNFSVEQMKRVQPIHPIASLQPPYSMLVRDVENEILPFCLKNQIGVIAYSPMRNGLLTGKYDAERIRNLPADDWRHRSSDFNEPRLSANLRLVDSLIEVAKSKGITAAQLAIAWVNANPAVTAAIAGARSAQQVEELAPAADVELTLNDMSAIHRLILERDHALEP